MAAERNIDPELRGTDRLFALMALMEERLHRIDDRVADLVEAVDGKHADHEQRITDLEKADARRAGAMSVLLWAVPGGPVLVALAAWYVNANM